MWQKVSESVHLTGLIMTKMDGDARGGAAISIRSVTGVPIEVKHAVKISKHWKLTSPDDSPPEFWVWAMLLD